jgi:DNA-binding NarL/FixJ family response regulator
LLQHAPAVLVHTQEPAPRVHLACLLAGAAGVVHKSEPMERLCEALGVVAAGGVVLDPRTAQLIERLADQRRLDLTPTEAEVLALTAHAWTRRQISRHLDAAESTVDKHLRALREKFGHDRNLVDLADDFGLRDLAIPTRADANAATAVSELRTLRDRLRRMLGAG